LLHDKRLPCRNYHQQEVVFAVAAGAQLHEIVGARDDLDRALLRVSRVVLAATVRAGTAVEPVLSPTQIRTLTVIAPSGDEGLSLTAVAEALSASRPSASRICKRLVRDGLVSRAAGPGNELRLTLSPAGRALLAEVNQIRADRLRNVLAQLSDDDQYAATRAFEHMADEANAQNDHW